MSHILSIIIFIPTVVAFLMLLSHNLIKGAAKTTALIVTGIEFVLSVFIFTKLDVSQVGLQLIEKHKWIESFRVQYFVGVDGASTPLLLFTTLVFFLCTVYVSEIKKAESAFFALVLLLESTILGFLCAQDLFLLFTFWTAMILPVYFLISYWGGKNKDKAAVRFFMSQMFSSLLMIIGIFSLYYQASPHTFDITELSGGKFVDAIFTIGNKEFHFERFMYWLFFIAFAFRMPVFPLHGWFVHVQSEAGSILTVLMAGIFIKTGMYSLIKINYPIFSNAAKDLAHPIMIFAVVNVIYAALTAVSQKDIKKTISHALICSNGIILFGFQNFTSAALQGAFLQLIFAGLIFGATAFLTEALSSRDTQGVTELKIDKFAGLFNKVPVLTFFFTMTLFSIIGMPGFGPFVSQSMIMLGGYESHKILTTIAVFGSLLTASYLVWMYRKVFLGTSSESISALNDLTIRERISVAPLIILSVVFGLVPTFVMDISKVSIDQLLQILGK